MTFGNIVRGRGRAWQGAYMAWGHRWQEGTGRGGMHGKGDMCGRGHVWWEVGGF